MAKNELLPFADGEDANVLPTAQWEALTDILENGFQSGIAKSEQVNRVLAQGAVASYVLGQLIVDQLDKDATLDKDTLYQNIVKALQENAKDVCLPLSGGTMTGTITNSSGTPLKSSSDSMRTHILGATAWDKGAHLVLSGKDANGTFELGAHDGTNTAKLVGYPNGWLNWNNHDVLTSAGGVLRGTFECEESVFAKRNVTNSDIVVLGGRTADDGAYFQATGKDSWGGGEFWIVAKDSTRKIELRGKPDGTLTWGGSSLNPVTHTYQSGQNWAIKFANGFIMQGGCVNGTGNTVTVSFHYPFASVPGTVLGHLIGESSRNNAYQEFPHTITATSFKALTWSGFPLTWFACGY